MLLQFQFCLDTPEGHRMGGETILFGSTTLKVALGEAESMLQTRTFRFGKANLCLIKDENGKIIHEVRLDRQPPDQV
jgi:hypothetical protein